jgi:hypothetical protein
MSSIRLTERWRSQSMGSYRSGEVVMEAADVRVFIERELAAHTISRPDILFDLLDLGIAFEVRPDRFTSQPFVTLRAGDNTAYVRTHWFTDVMPEAMTLEDDTDVSWVIEDLELAEALARLVCPDADMQGLGRGRRFEDALDAVKAAEHTK